MAKETPPSDASSVAPSLAFTRAQDYKAFYTDVHRIRIGNGDVTMTFSKVSHAPSAQALSNIIEEQASVSMSWAQFKMLVQNAASLLSAIEEEVGPIAIPNAFKVNESGNRAIVQGLGLTRS